MLRKLNHAIFLRIIGVYCKEKIEVFRQSDNNRETQNHEILSTHSLQTLRGTHTVGKHNPSEIISPVGCRRLSDAGTWMARLSASKLVNCALLEGPLNP